MSTTTTADSGPIELTPLGVLVGAVRRAGQDHAVKYGRYADMTIVTGTGLWFVLLDELLRILPPPTATGTPGRGTEMVLAAPGGRGARVLSSPELPDRAWTLTFDSGFDGEI